MLWINTFHAVNVQGEEGVGGEVVLQRETSLQVNLLTFDLSTLSCLELAVSGTFMNNGYC